MLYLGDRPHSARHDRAEAFVAAVRGAAQPRARRRARPKLLTAGRPRRLSGRLTVEAVGGAIWHTVRCQVACGRIHLLPVLSDYLCYVGAGPVHRRGGGA